MTLGESAAVTIMAPEPSPPGGLARRSGMQLMAAVAGLAALSAVACIAYMGPAAQVAAPAELVVSPAP